MKRLSLSQKALLATKPVDESTSKFLWDVHKYTNDYIRFGDTKASFVAAAVTAIIGTLVSSKVLDGCYTVCPCAWNTLQWIANIALFPLTASVVCAVCTIRPRLWNKTKIGYIFWGSIVGHSSPEEFAEKVKAMSNEDRTSATAEHLYVLACIANRKYGFVDYAVNLGIVGGFLAAIVLLQLHTLKATP